MSDQTDLRDFLNETEALLTEIIDRRAEFIPEELQPYFVEAWPEVRASISTAKDDLFTRVVVSDRLPSAGLTGKQLALKLFAFRRSVDALKLGGWSRRLLKRVLDWLNTILGSLASVLPGVDAIKEFKEAIENALDEKEE